MCQGQKSLGLVLFEVMSHDFVEGEWHPRFLSTEAGVHISL